MKFTNKRRMTKEVILVAASEIVFTKEFKVYHEFVNLTILKMRDILKTRDTWKPRLL